MSVVCTSIVLLSLSSSLRTRAVLLFGSQFSTNPAVSHPREKQYPKRIWYGHSPPPPKLAGVSLDAKAKDVIAWHADSARLSPPILSFGPWHEISAHDVAPSQSPAGQGQIHRMFGRIPWHSFLVPSSKYPHPTDFSVCDDQTTDTGCFIKSRCTLCFLFCT